MKVKLILTTKLYMQ